MLQLRPRESLGGGDFGWLRAKHHFAVDDSGNRAHTPLGSLIVWNDDEIAPRSGFPLHGHRDMEIFTYVRHGVLQHEDSLGGRGEIRAGTVQAMTAGRGIRHREFNSGDDPLSIFQIWMLPRRRDLQARWNTRSFADARRPGEFVTLASGYDDDRDALQIDADARVLGATLESGQRITYPIGPTRSGYLVPARGTVTVNNQRVNERDGIAIVAEADIVVTATAPAELILVDVR